MKAYVLSPFDANDCKKEVKLALPLAKIESNGSELIVTQGRHQLRLTVEGWGGSQENQNRFEGIRSEVTIDPVVLQEPGETSDLAFSDVDDERLKQMLCSVVNVLQPIERWRDDVSVSPSDSL